MKNNNSAFTLIEALVAAAITAIGFAGVSGLVSTSNEVMRDTIDREKLKFQNTEIIESLSSDQANIMEYHGKDLSNCSNIATSAGREDQLRRLVAWCNKMNGDVNTMGRQITRTVSVVRRTIRGADVFIVSLRLGGKTDNKSVFMKRVVYAP
jgi:type II secretory pathway pseudopilin PulG